jgi:hypothetical protein
MVAVNRNKWPTGWGASNVPKRDSASELSTRFAWKLACGLGMGAAAGLSWTSQQRRPIRHDAADASQ